MDIYSTDSWITLRTLAFNGLWVLGIAINLAVLSFVIYERRLGHHGSLVSLLHKRDYSNWLMIGTLLITIGAALTASRIWQSIVFGLCALVLVARRLAENQNPESTDDTKN